MAGTIINTGRNWTTVDHALTPAPGGGMAFNDADAPDQINIAVGDNTLLALVKSTGAVVFATDANTLSQLLSFYEPTARFWLTGGGGAPGVTAAILDELGALLSNPSAGNNPYAVVFDAAGNAWIGDTGGTFVFVLDQSGAAVTSIDTGNFGVSAEVGQAVFDGTSIWMTGVTPFLYQFDAASFTLVNTYDLSLQGIAFIGGLCFDGTQLWIDDRTNRTLNTVNLSGVVTGTFTGNLQISGPLVFDGTYIWELDYGGILNIFALDGTQLTSIGVPTVGIGTPSFIANDPGEGPGFVWVTFAGGAPTVQQYQFIPAPVKTGGVFEGTHVGFFGAGKFGGGTKENQV